MGQEIAIDRMMLILDSCLDGIDGPDEMAIAFSGGLDSTVLTASVLKKFGPRTRLRPVVVGVEGSNDPEMAAMAAKELGLELETITISVDSIIDAIPKVSKYAGTTDPVVVSFTIPLFFVLNSKGPSKVLVGHGGDELFGGYSRYLEVEPSVLQDRMDADLDILMERVDKDRKMAKELGRELLTPFLCPVLVENAKALPPELKVSNGERKVALRSMARKLGLSEPLVTMKKTAAQYGSGVMKVLKKEHRRRGHPTVEAFLKEIISENG